MWGGRLRDTDTGPGGTGIAHCRPQFIPAEADRIFTALAGADHLRGRDADAFATGLAWVWGDTTALHPFRDVNTRSQFVFFTQLAARAGWIIDWATIDVDAFAHARTVAITGDESGLEALIRPALRTVEHVGADGIGGGLPISTDRSAAHRTPRAPTQLDRALHAAIERRRSLGGHDQPPETPPPSGPRSLGV